MNTNNRPDSRQENPRTRTTRRRSADAKESFKEELINIARQLFEKEGSAAVSMRAIASQAGVSPMAVYRYFPNKMTLLSRLWDSVFLDLAQTLESRLDPSLPMSRQALDALDIYIDFWLERPEHFRMIYVEPALNPQAQAELTFWNDSHGLARLRSLVARRFGHSGPLAGHTDVPPAVSAAVEQLTIYLSGLLHTLIGRAQSPWLDPQRARRNARAVTLQILNLPALETEPEPQRG